MSNRNVRIGGLMRCCIESVARYDGPEVPGETVIPCIYEHGKLTVRLADDGIWEWVGPGGYPGNSEVLTSP